MSLHEETPRSSHSDESEIRCQTLGEARSLWRVKSDVRWAKQPRLIDSRVDDERQFSFQNHRSRHLRRSTDQLREIERHCSLEQRAAYESPLNRIYVDQLASSWFYLRLVSSCRRFFSYFIVFLSFFPIETFFLFRKRVPPFSSSRGRLFFFFEKVSSSSCSRGRFFFFFFLAPRSVIVGARFDLNLHKPAGRNFGPITVRV